MSNVELSLIVLRSADVERAGRFYNLLGLRFDRERHGSGPEHMVAQIGPAILEIYPQESQPDSIGVRLGFRVASVDAVIEAVRRESGTVLSPPKRSRWGYVAVLTDPDGRRVEISQVEDAESDDPTRCRND